MPQCSLGPWRCTDDFRVIAADGNLVCAVPSAAIDRIGPDTCAANCSLIAAAPNLFEAACCVLDNAIECGSAFPESPGLSNDDQEFPVDEYGHSWYSDFWNLKQAIDDVRKGQLLGEFFRGIEPSAGAYADMLWRVLKLLSYSRLAEVVERLKDGD